MGSSRSSYARAMDSGELLIGLATVGLAIATTWMAKKTKDLGAEAVRDRELAYIAHVEVSWRSQNGAVGNVSINYHEVLVRNVGVGPALGVICMFRAGGATEWQLTFPRDLEANGGQFPTRYSQLRKFDEEHVPVWMRTAQSPKLGLVLTWRDVLGRRYRLCIDTGSVGGDPEMVDMRGDDIPDWARNPFLFPAPPS